MKAVTEAKVIKNAWWIIISKVFQSLLQLVVLILVARHLGPAEFGIINYAISIVVFLTPLAFIGLNNILVHEIIKNPQIEGLIIGTSISLSVFSSLLCAGLVIFFVQHTNSGEVKLQIVCVLYSLILIFQSLELIKYWFQAKLLAKYASIISLFVYAIITIYNLSLYIFEMNVYWFSVSNVIVFLLTSLLLFKFYFKLGGQPLNFSREIATTLWRKSKHFILPSIMVAIFAQTDRIMIQQMIGDEGVGLYSSAFSIASMASFFYLALIDSFRPLIFKYSEVSNIKFDYYIKKICSVIIYLSLCQVLVVFFFSEYIIEILFGSEYIEASNTLRIMCWYIMLSFLSVVRNIWILSCGLEKHLLIINLAGAFFNVFLNYFFIQGFGIEGAAFASLITQVVTNFLITYAIPDMRKINVMVLMSFNPKYLRTILIKSYQFGGRKK